MLLREASAFVRSVELNSLTAAARSLGISTAAVSTRIAQLEQHYGVQLLARTTRGLQPTEAGQIFYPHATRILQAMEDAQASVSNLAKSPQGRLSVRAPIGFGRQFLAPLVSEFHLVHPEIEIRLRLSDLGGDLFDDECDVALQFGDLADSSLVVRALARCEPVLCAAPRYVAGAGSPLTPSDLADHQCLVMRVDGLEEKTWALATESGMEDVRVGGRLAADCGDVLIELAVGGDGIVRRPLWEVADHLASGSLVEILPTHRPAPLPLNILHRSRRLTPTKIKLFSDFVAQRLRPRLDARLRRAAA